MYVIKASGKKEEFKPEKVFGTLTRAGATQKLAKEIVKEIEKKVYEGMKTREILDTALDLLKSKKPEIGAVYDLKRAVMSLGPTGFPFEKFFAEILKNQGYQTEIGRVYKGKITSHEVDITAKKEKSYMVEAKYHNSPGIYTNLKVALYVHARFLDLKKYFDSSWLVTNTKLSKRAFIYAKGMGMKVTSWGYPEKESLQVFVEKKKLYPITILKTVDHHIKEKLSNANIILVRNILDLDMLELKRKTRISEEILKKIISEAEKISKVKTKV
jgi:hypothetical protein